MQLAQHNPWFTQKDTLVLKAIEIFDKKRCSFPITLSEEEYNKCQLGGSRGWQGQAVVVECRATEKAEMGVREVRQDRRSVRTLPTNCNVDHLQLGLLELPFVSRAAV